MGLVRVGVDVGQKVDPTAICVAEPEGDAFMIRYLQRLALGMPYPKIAERLAELVGNLTDRLYRQAWAAIAKQPGSQLIDQAALRREAEASIWLLIDATGVGGPVCDMVTEPLRGTAVSMTRVLFTYGDRYKGGWGRREAKLGKAYLVSRLQALLQGKRVKLPRTAEAQALAEELLDYEIKVTEDGNDKYGAFKVGSHDDLVTALGLACLHDRDAGQVQFMPSLYGPGPEPQTARERAAAVHDDSQLHRQWAKRHFCQQCHDEWKERGHQ